MAATLSAQAAAMAPAPQFSSAQGQFSNWAVGVTTSSGVAAGHQNQVQIRAPGIASSLPTSWTRQKFGAATPIHPNYSVAKLTEAWGLGAFTATTQLFAATSTGGDVTPVVLSDGTLRMDATTWYALTFSVEPGSTGVSGSRLNTRHLANGAIAGDVFSYYPSGSSLLNPLFQNALYVETPHDQFGLHATGDVTNLDYGMGLIAVDPMAEAPELAPIRNEFYFTLSRQWLNPASPTPPPPLLWQDRSTLAMRRPTCSDICRMVWEIDHWDTPTIEYSADVLFAGGPHAALLEPGLREELEIDAISVYRAPADALRPAQERVIFSLEVGPTYPLAINQTDQLLVSQVANGTPGLYYSSPAIAATPLRTLVPSGSIRVSERLGLRQGIEGDPDDIDSTCGTDPIRPELPGPVSANPQVGLALNGMYVGEGALGMSFIRTVVPEEHGPDAIVVPPPLTYSNLDITGFQHTPGHLQFWRLLQDPSPPSMTTMPQFVEIVPYQLLDPVTQPTRVSFSYQINTAVAKTKQFLVEQWSLDLSTGLPHVAGRSWVLTLKN